jgi:ssRNA-specific RNase YbeY (16S rRNA maturation enzyme)
MTITVDIEIEDAAWTNAEPEAEALVWRAAQAVLDAHQDIDGQGIVILLTDDDSIQALNRDFRQKDYATNVLSFPSAQNPEANPEGRSATSPWPTASAPARPPSRASLWATTCNIWWRTACFIF